MRTVVDQIVDRAGGPGALTILGDDAGVLAHETWAHVHQRARRMAAVLAGRGLGPGCRVGLVADTGVDLVCALQAVWLRGGAVNLMPPHPRGGTASHVEYLRAVTADARLQLLIVDGTWQAHDLGAPTLALADLAEQAHDAAMAAPLPPDPGDLALLQYTSGSTRAPRGVPVTHRHLTANVEAIKAALGHDRPHESRTYSWLPLYHDMGLIAFFTMPMSCGCPLLLQSPASFARRPASWLQALSQHRVTLSGAPNFAYALMARLLPGRENLDLSAVQCLISGGEPVDAGVMGRFLAGAQPFGLSPHVLMPAYGLAEATLCVTAAPWRTGMRQDWIDQGALEALGQAVPCPPERGRPLVSVGPPMRGTSVRVTDRVTGAALPDRRVGHVEVRGPAVVGHYWGEPAPPEGSWLRTGDLGYLTAGELVVCGREKDVLFAAGRNIYPQDVEAAAAQVPGVRPGGAAAFAVSNQDSDRLVVVVEARAQDAAAVRQQVADTVLDEVSLSAEVIVVPLGALPKTSSGKLRRAEARRTYLANEFKLQTPPRVAEMERT